MKVSYILNILLSAALLTTVVITNNKSTMQPTETDTVNTSIENILTRTSIRSYTDREVTDEQIDTLMHAAMAAPTAMNKQPWQFVVIKDRELLDSIAENFPNIKMASQAQIAVMVCGDMNLAIEGNGQAYWIQDTSAATENLLLAAHGMGLGAVWCGIYPIEERVAKVKQLFNLPDNIIPLNIIPIGYPSTDTAPKDKYDASRIHIDKFQS